jgi:cell shape-determining protein MreD
MYLNNALKFFGLFALQVLIVSHFELSYYINPYVHLLFLLTLPNTIPFAALLIIAFLSGLTLDMFLNTTGLHAAASVLIAFIRPFLLNLLTPKGSYEATQNPNINSPGLTWFVGYLLFNTFIYCFFYFMLEVFTFREFHRTFWKIILSTLFSVMLMTMLAYLFSPGKKRRSI